MLNKLVIKTLEDGTQFVSFSPRRLAKSYYCGVAGYHDRYSPGSPMTGGIQFGSRVDQAIGSFISDKLGPEEGQQIDRELEFFVFNTPPATPDTKSGVELKTTYNIPGTKYNVLLIGIADVLYPGVRVVEIKTGKPKDWHKIQALSYACITGLPCQIVYVTRGFSIFIEPDWDELLRITRVCLENELGKIATKCEHCAFCSLKPMCSEFTSDNDYIRVLCALKTLVDNSEDKKLKKQHTLNLKAYIRLANNYLAVGETYEFGGYLVGTRSSEDDPTKIHSLVFRKKDYFEQGTTLQ